MTVEVIIGDLLEASENVIVHQVNCKGKMNSEIAKQIRNKYPDVYGKYAEYCKSKTPRQLLGGIQAVEVCKDKFVLNLFGQLDYGYDGRRYTSYDALYNGLEHVKNAAKEKGLSVALPYKIGSDRGGASWGVVYKMIEEIFNDYKVTIYKLEDV